MSRTIGGLIGVAAVCVCSVGADWTQFRGQAASGKGEGTDYPVEWNSSKNLKWRRELPGAGASSPIILKGKVFITCYSGYGVDAIDAGEMSKLTRHLVCFDIATGGQLWDRKVPAVLPEDQYNGQLGQHGYATHTPVSDGENVYVFFGKSGVHGYDLKGNKLWSTDVGKESGRQGWGSASSPILYKDSIIVNAADESQSVRAIDKKSGQIRWSAPAGSLENIYSSPALANLSDGGRELIVNAQYEVWGLNPDTGKLKWFIDTGFNGNLSATVQVVDGVIYAFGGSRGGGIVAIKPGGDGDVTKSHVIWQNRKGPDFGTPVIVGSHIYWVSNRGVATCVNAKTGDVVFEERLESESGFPQVYASPVLVGKLIYVVSRNVGAFVFKASPEFEQIQQNKFSADPTDFNATPALSDGKIFIRSNLYLYCVGKS